MTITRKKGFFSISAVAHMFGVHQQTIRMYEKLGLIHPERSAGNTRLFTEEAIAELEEVIYLTHQMGVNLAGVEIIMRLKKEMRLLQNEINEKFAHTQEQLTRAAELRTNAIELHRSQLKKRRFYQKGSEDNDMPTVTQVPSP